MIRQDVNDAVSRFSYLFHQETIPFKGNLIVKSSTSLGDREYLLICEMDHSDTLRVILEVSFEMILDDIEMSDCFVILSQQSEWRSFKPSYFLLTRKCFQVRSVLQYIFDLFSRKNRKAER